MMRVAVLQSNYIPWKGYFDIIHDVDVFYFYDDVQYTSGDWRNRNRIKTAAGERWLTVPVGKGHHRRICDVALPPTDWADEHWRRLRGAYRAAPYFEAYREFFDDLYLGRRWQSLSELNQAFTVAIARSLLGVATEFRHSSSVALTATKGERLIELLTRVGATTYVSGPAARAYIDDAAFTAAGLRVEWKDYRGYPEYPQLHPPFSHQVTILDLLFHTGPAAPRHIWGWRDRIGQGAAA
jgi:hypothetical protein